MVRDALSRLCHPVRNLLTPGKIVWRFFMRHRGIRIFKHFVEDEPGGIIGELNYIKPDITGFFIRALRIVDRGGDEVVDMLGFYGDMDEGCFHKRLQVIARYRGRICGFSYGVRK